MPKQPHLFYGLLLAGCGYLVQSAVNANAAENNQNTNSQMTSNNAIAVGNLDLEETSKHVLESEGQDELTLSQDELENTSDDVEDIPIEQIRNFVETFQIVKSNYVDAVSDDELFSQATHGLVEELDPYSRYLDEEHYRQLMEFTEGEIAEPDFRLVYNTEQQYWQLRDIRNNSENYRLGLRNGQIVERINNINLQNLDERAIKSQLTGAMGSILTLRINGQGQAHDIDIIRQQKVSYEVEPFLTDDRILVLRIKAFQQNTTAQVQQLIQAYQQRVQIRGLLIDIRDNPGGLLSVAVDLADLFLEQGLIVSTKGRTEPIQRFQALPSQNPIHYPIAILQNRYSASASEVFAAALKEHHRATILGETSYGKGAVQKLFPLKQGALQLTVSHYYTPDGHLIEGKGISPDEPLSMSHLVSDQQIINQAVLAFERILQRRPASQN